MVVVMQAALTFQETTAFVSHDAIAVDLPPSVARQFAACVDGRPLPDNIGVTCSQPGRLVVDKPTVWADMLGDMTSMPPSLVRIAARHAVCVDAPSGLCEFLAVCASNGLCLNKYVVPVAAAATEHV